VCAIEIISVSRRRRRTLGPRRRRLRDVRLIVLAAAVRRSRIARQTVQCAASSRTDRTERSRSIVGPRVGGGHTCRYRGRQTVRNRDCGERKKNNKIIITCRV